MRGLSWGDGLSCGNKKVSSNPRHCDLQTYV